MHSRCQRQRRSKESAVAVPGFAGTCAGARQTPREHVWSAVATRRRTRRGDTAFLARQLLRTVNALALSMPTPEQGKRRRRSRLRRDLCRRTPN